MNIKYYKSTSYDPFYNLALEQYLFDHKLKGEAIVYIWQNDKTVVIGRYQNIFDEVDLEYAQEHGIRTVRRITGGGAVYHDLGNLNYTFIVDLDSDDLDTCFALLRRVLAKFDIEAEMRGRNDLVADGYKISGTAQHISNGKLLHHGTLLVNSNLEILEKVLTRKNKIVKSKAQRSVKKRVINLSELLGKEILISSIVEEFCKDMKEEIMDNSFEEVIKLAKNKFETDEWNYGFQPLYQYQARKRFGGGTLVVSASINNGILEQVNFSGDFFGKRNIEELENGLIGCKVDDLPLKLHELNANDYIYGIKEADIWSCFNDITIK